METTTTRPNRKDVIAFRPIGKKNRVHVIVEGTCDPAPCVSDVFPGSFIVEGFRCTPWGSVDSQAQGHAWMVGEFEVIA